MSRRSLTALLLAGCLAVACGAGASSPAGPTATSATPTPTPSPSGATPPATPSATPTGGEVMTPSPSVAFSLTSSAFKAGGAIPRPHTCDGVDHSPPLAIEGVPAATASFALVVRDPDARGWVHWVAYAIPAATRELPSGAGGAVLGPVGLTSWGSAGYRGPCPPTGTHHYVFTLYALSGKLPLSGHPTADQVEAAARSSTIAKVTLTGTYHR
ncbi:MAG: YbhB/YbcL family Raf kinase inhibitor-like protein [Candidatus Limnocylindrales bacterium]